MKRIPLTRGQFALVDDADFESLSKHKWSAHWAEDVNGFYAERNIVRNGKRTTIRMNRVIMGEPKGMQVDHINHKTLDNRRKNLRVVTRSQNQMNSLPRKNKSGYKGVAFYENKLRPYRVNIRVGGKQFHVGYYSTAKRAALAYNLASKKHYKEFGLPNKI